MDFSQPFYNTSAGNMTAFKAALQAAGTTTKRIGFFGDSTTKGAGAESQAIGRKPQSGPVQLAALLNGLAIATEIDSFLGNGELNSTIANYKLFDTRFTSTAAWNNGTAGVVGAGGQFFGSGTAASKFTFTPGNTFDTFDFYYLEPAVGRSILVDVGGGTILTLSNSGQPTNTPMARLAVAAGGTVSVVQATSGSAANITVLGVRTYTASEKKLSLISSGIGSAKIADWVSTAQVYFPKLWIPGLAFDATFINITINDANAATSLTTYGSDMQSLITAAKLTGGVCLVVGAPTNNGSTLAQQKTYWNKCVELAIANNIPVLNLFYYFGDWANANAQGWMFDVSHPNTAGYAVWAQAYLEFLQLALAS